MGHALAGEGDMVTIDNTNAPHKSGDFHRIMLILLVVFCSKKSSILRSPTPSHDRLD